jgi:hypothetical protein
LNGTFYVADGAYVDGRLYLSSEIGGFSMAKLERNRGMFFGSWTGNAIPESATVNIGDSTGVTACVVVATTFGTGVSGISGEYVFTYDGTNWMLNGTAVASITTTYGLTITGEAANGDILVVTYAAAASGWEALGKDNDDLSKELNPDTETSKNVLGETSFTHSGYEPEISVDPYYIDPSRKMYARLLEVALEERYGESDLGGYFAEAYFQTANKATGKMTGYAYVRQAWYVPQSVGGDTAGYAIPVNINPVGPMTKKKIVYDMATNEATITDLA